MGDDSVMEIIERKIQFYQVIWIKDDRYIRKDQNFINDILKKIPIITAADPSFNIYIESFNGGSLINENSDKSFWRISKIRKTDLPLKFNINEKKSSPLNLSENEGLQEPSHFIVFNGAFIGAELNFNAPRVATTLYREINKYLESNPNETIGSVEINPIFREEAYKKIDKMGEISSVLIKLSTNYAKVLNKLTGQQDCSFGKTFASSEAAEDLYLGIQFYVGRGKRPKPRMAFSQIISDIRELFNQPECFDNIEAAKVRGKQFGSDRSL